MRKSKKIFLRILPVLLVAVMFASSIFAAGFNDFTTGNIGVEANKDVETVKVIQNAWGVILTILQVAAIAAIIFAGVKYMFAGADAKADIKKQIIWLVVGALLVFASTTVIGFLTGTFKAITGQ